MFYKRKLIDWGFDEDLLTYIPNFIDSECYECDTTPGNYFLYLGRLSEEKGVSTLIKAASLSNADLVVAGTGPMEQELKSLGAKTRSSRIKFVGYVSGPSLRQLVRGARALVLPSEWYENAPISVLEAYASGTPVLGADIGGIPEMVKREETGDLFPSGDTEALASLLAKFQNMSPGILKTMGQASRTFVEEEFSRQRYADAMLDLYESLRTTTSTVRIPTHGRPD